MIDLKHILRCFIRENDCSAVSTLTKFALKLKIVGIKDDDNWPEVSLNVSEGSDALPHQCLINMR